MGRGFALKLELKGGNKPILTAFKINTQFQRVSIWVGWNCRDEGIIPLTIKSWCLLGGGFERPAVVRGKKVAGNVVIIGREIEIEHTAIDDEDRRLTLK